MSNADKIKLHSKRAKDALAALRAAETPEAQLAAAQTLESAACQLRRALKKEVGQ